MVANLLDRFCLPDEALMDKYYGSASTGKGERWLAKVNSCRNTVMHDAWFNWEDKPPDLQELGCMCFHLHDVAVRITLKLLGYDGEYLPSVPKLANRNMSLDWPWERTESFVRDLGYAKG
jgi:hypothetical protein